MLEERLEKIMAILKKQKYMTNTELCQRLFCSQSTLRRDLIKLEKAGLVIRTYGGATIVTPTNHEFSYFFRETERPHEKAYICDLARNFITHGQGIFLDSSSTVNKLCPYLDHYTNLIVVTNCLKNALNLSRAEQTQVFIAGGHLKKNSTSIIGEMAGAFLEHFKVDIAFISCRGIDLNGIYEADLDQALFKQHMIENAKKTILLCDNSKFNSEHFFKLTTFDKIDALITNKKPQATYQEKLAASGCELIY